MKKEICFTELLGKQTQLGNQIWPVFVILKRNTFIKKILKKCVLETGSRPFCVL